MKFLTPKRIAGALAILAFAAVSFLMGFSASIHLRSPAGPDLRGEYLHGGGSAPPEVRSQVLTALRAFQEGYVKRDVKELDAFMSRLFAQGDNEVLLMGTDTTEWRRGYHDVAEFIKEDWLKWGDFRFHVDDALVWSSGDVAWTASIGALQTPHGDRPLRFATILNRNGENWVFRQLHYQWDEPQPSTSDLLHPKTQVRLVKIFYDRVRQKTRSLFTSNRQ
jgi:hypothetical protein